MPIDVRTASNSQLRKYFGRSARLTSEQAASIYVEGLSDLLAVYRDRFGDVAFFRFAYGRDGAVTVGDVIDLIAPRRKK